MVAAIHLVSILSIMYTPIKLTLQSSRTNYFEIDVQAQYISKSFSYATHTKKDIGKKKTSEQVFDTLLS